MRILPCSATFLLRRVDFQLLLCVCFATCSCESVADLWWIQAQRFDTGHARKTLRLNTPGHGVWALRRINFQLLLCVLPQFRSWFVCFATFSCTNVASWWGFFRVPPHFCCAWVDFQLLLCVFRHMFVWKRSWFIVDSSVTFWHRTCSKNALVEHARPWCLGPAKDQFSGAFVCFSVFRHIFVAAFVCVSPHVRVKA